MAKHTFERTWPRWAGTVSDLEAIARTASAAVEGGTLQIEVHRQGLGTSIFADGSEMSQALTIPDLARIDVLTVRVDRPRAQALSRIAVSLRTKVPGVTVEVQGSDQTL